MLLSVISKPLKANIRFGSRSEPLIELVIMTSIRGSCRLMESWEQEVQTRSALCSLEHLPVKEAATTQLDI